MAWKPGGKPPIISPGRGGKPKPKPKPAPKPAPKPVDQGGVPPVATGTPADHPTLDVAAMSAAGGSSTAPDTQVTTSGGPQQAGAVFSTGAGSAPQLSYQQATTYQQVYADQVAQGQGGSG